MVRYGDSSFLIASLADPLRGRESFVLRTEAGEEVGCRQVTLSTTPCRSALHQEEIYWVSLQSSLCVLNNCRRIICFYNYHEEIQF